MRRPSPALALLALLGIAACAPEGPSAFVTYNLVPNSDCVYTPEANNLFMPIGIYDVAVGGAAESEDARNCDAPYVVHLLINSYLRPGSDVMLGRAEPNILQIHSAEVKLMTIDRLRIRFVYQDENGEEQELPNPFLVTTNNSLFPATGANPTRGVAAVEAIPTDYAEFLASDMFIGTQILAQIQIFGTTTGDVDVEFKPFVYAIEICYGCLTLCLDNDLAANGLTVDDVVGDDCHDNSASDGRVCIDPDC